MPTFPTLSTDPIDRDFQETLTVDPSIRSRMEDGLVISRARDTITKKLWKVIPYNNITEEDKLLLDAFQDEVKVGAATFDWTNPRYNIVYVVRFVEPIKYTIHPGRQGIWLAEFSLEEA